MIGHLLNRTAEVWRPSHITTDMGGSEVEWTSVGDVACRMSRPTATEREISAQRGVETTHNVYLNTDADVRRNDRLVDGDLTVEIVSTVTPSVFDHHVKAEGREEPWRAPIEEGS